MPDEIEVTAVNGDSTVESLFLRVERTPSPTHRSVYCNNAQVTLTFYDFRIRLGQVIAVEPELLRVEDEVTVYMTPEHARALIGAMQSQLIEFEKRFGPLRSDPKPK